MLSDNLIKGREANVRSSVNRQSPCSLSKLSMTEQFLLLFGTLSEWRVLPFVVTRGDVERRWPEIKYWVLAASVTLYCTVVLVVDP